MIDVTRTRRGVILAASGEGDGSAANRAVAAWADELRAARPGLEVAVAFEKGTPGFAQAIDALAERGVRDVTVVPMGATAAAADVLATLAQDQEPWSVRVVPPIGSWRLAQSAAVWRAMDAVAGAAGDVSVLVVGEPGSAEATQDLADDVAAALPGVAVRALAFDRDIEGVVRTVRTSTLLVVPMLIGSGPSSEELGRAIRAVADDRRVIIAGAAGNHGEIAEALREVARDRLPEPVTRTNWVVAA